MLPRQVVDEVRRRLDGGNLAVSMSYPASKSITV
jgi:hypothetical protein